jgi:Flp pilus assembly protein TadG
MSERRLVAQERGQAATELALVLPILLVIFLGIVQLEIVFNHYLALTDAVRSGARAAATSAGNDDPAGAAEAVVRDAASGLDGLEVSVDSDWQPGSKVTVTASVPYDIGVLGLVVTSGRLTSRTIERVE